MLLAAQSTAYCQSVWRKVQEEMPPAGCYYRVETPSGTCVQIRRNSDPCVRWRGDPSQPWYPGYGLLVWVPWHSAGVYRRIFATCARLILFGAERDDVNGARATNSDNPAMLRSRSLRSALADQDEEVSYQSLWFSDQHPPVGAGRFPASPGRRRQRLRGHRCDQNRPSHPARF